MNLWLRDLKKYPRPCIDNTTELEVLILAEKNIPNAIVSTKGLGYYRWIVVGEHYGTKADVDIYY